MIDDCCYHSDLLVAWIPATGKIACSASQLLTYVNPTERETLGAYHLARISGNFGLKSNGVVIFEKFLSEIVEYLQKYSSFSVRNGMAEISLPFAKLSSLQSLISRKQLREIEVQMVSAISFGWFADLRKTLTIIQRSSQPVYSDKW